jgi:hypothetical protein
MNLEDLIGKWKISRTLSTLDGTPQGTMEGTGNFELYEKSQLLYQEQLWHATEHEDILFATKFYRYYFGPDKISIYFYKEENNRLFMTVPFQDMKGDALCNKDCYHLQWDWINKDHFLTRYTIIGPKKNTLIESEFKQ